VTDVRWIPTATPTRICDHLKAIRVSEYTNDLRVCWCMSLDTRLGESSDGRATVSAHEQHHSNLIYPRQTNIAVSYAVSPKPRVDRRNQSLPMSRVSQPDITVLARRGQRACEAVLYQLNGGRFKMLSQQWRVPSMVRDGFTRTGQQHVSVRALTLTNESRFVSRGFF